MKPDFSDLYFQLGLRPDCSLEELKRAYHRRVARLHPDRPDAESTATSGLPLAELMALYGAATRFHRRYGRLPGAASRPSGTRPVPPRRRQIDLAFALSDTRSTLFQPGLMLAAIALGLILGLGWVWNGTIEGWLQRTMQRRTTPPVNATQRPADPLISTTRAATLPSPTRPADADCLLHTAPPRVRH